MSNTDRWKNGYEAATEAQINSPHNACQFRADCRKAEAKLAALRDVLIHKGFVECCGAWHHRYGLPERWAEIKEMLIDADVLNNDTGNKPLNAIKKLIAQRDGLQERLREDAFHAGMTRAVDIARAIAGSESEEGNDSYGVGWQIADRILKSRKVKGRG